MELASDLTAVLQFIASAGAVLVGSAAIVTAIGIVAKSQYLGRPLRWLWRRNVSGPVAGWFRHIVGEVVDERIDHLMHHNNNGSSLLDLAQSVGSANDKIALLLSHDDERDTVGHRYAPVDTEPSPPP